jgi:hypothetical protein
MEETYENIIEASCFLSAWRRCSDSLLKVQRKCHVGRKRSRSSLMSREKSLGPLTALFMIADLASLLLERESRREMFRRGAWCGLLM